MYYNASMSAAFESEKNKKALTYTLIICVCMLLMAIFVSWQLPKPPEPVVQDLIEINLGNEVEGAGTVQPLIKGEKAPDHADPSPPVQHIAKVEPVKEDINPEENEKDEEAAVVPKPVKTPTPKVIQPTVVAVPVPKPQKPKIAGYGGPQTGTGNGATQDNGYRYQGNGNGKGDSGNPNGKPDSYGNHPGGKSGGLRVSKGDRTIVNNYIFMGDLPKATINAVIKVTPDGRGTFISFDRGSTSNESTYASAIRSYLPNIQFSKADHESVVTVPFNFRVN